MQSPLVKRILRACLGVGTLAIVSAAFIPSRSAEAAANLKYISVESCCYSALECPCIRVACQSDPEWACEIANCPPRSQC